MDHDLGGARRLFELLLSAQETADRAKNNAFNMQREFLTEFSANAAWGLVGVPKNYIYERGSSRGWKITELTCTIHHGKLRITPYGVAVKSNGKRVWERAGHLFLMYPLAHKASSGRVAHQAECQWSFCKKPPIGWDDPWSFTMSELQSFLGSNKGEESNE